MPPQRTKKNRASGASIASQAENTKSGAIQSPEARTPDRNPTQQGPIITLAQKQALIDNLQLEISERARKLRAQYALHAQGLRSRLEMRINRIPQSLRSTNIEELINKYSEQLEAPKSKPVAALKPALAKSALRARSPPVVVQSSSPARTRGVKRSSNEMMAGSDKENAQVDLDMPKKRTKVTATSSTATLAPPTRAGRAASRRVDPCKVLSPKSHNSRQLPQSPFKVPASPGKSYLARPVSPIKPGTVQAATASLASMVGPIETRKVPARPTRQATTAPTAGSVRGKRGAAATGPPVPPKNGRGRTISNSSDNSNTSTGTTVVTKKAPAAKRGIMSKMTGMASSTAKRTAAKKENAVPFSASAGGRSLRSRK
ncbi:hypothetical protein EJ08DRAFT_645525 [Tothia fuscella]|uniref:Borealin N-terminal domain-containing protein n=1 Tax=Tothia fuscella TaxID=1048955 RepID=A0A9P4U2J7_9PEZI|nr:hypothetical protein EJ08DRAFT_645525 [Tothia fuscella]